MLKHAPRQEWKGRGATRWKGNRPKQADVLDWYRHQYALHLDILDKGHEIAERP